MGIVNVSSSLPAQGIIHHASVRILRIGFGAVPLREP